MPDCEMLRGCVFFNDKMSNMPNTAESMKRKYCQGDNSLCARYKVFKAVGKEKVPSDLFPANIDKADKIIALI